MDQSRKYLIAHLATAAIFLLGAATMLLARNIFIIQVYIHDLYFVFDIAWRSALGEIPHLDFPSPIGQAFYWPFQLLGAFAPPTATTLLKANLLVAGLIALFAIPTLPKRLPPLFYVIAFAMLMGITITPRDADSLTSFSFLAPYNRWGWSLMGLGALIALLPRRDGARRGEWIDGIILGLVTALLAYLKITYCAGLGALILVALVMRSVAIRTVAIAITAALALLLIVELRFHNNLAYLKDLLDAMKIGTDVDISVRTRKLPMMLSVALVFTAALLGIAWLWQPTWSLRDYLRIWWRPLLFGLAIIAAGFLVAVQNHPKFEFNLYAIAMLVFTEHARRRMAAGDAAAVRRPVLRGSLPGLVAWIGVAGATAGLPLVDFTAAARHMIVRPGPMLCDVPAFAGTPLAGFLQRPIAFIAGNPKAPFARTCNEVRGASPPPIAPMAMPRQDEVPRAIEAMALLRPTARPDDTILTLSFGNPYPAALRLEPVRGAMPWWHAGRSFNDKVYPAIGPLLDGTTLILQPKPPEPFGPPLWKIYGKDIEARFTPIGETSLWRLWRRKDGIVTPR